MGSAPSPLPLSFPCLSSPLAVDAGAFLLRHQAAAQAAVPEQGQGWLAGGQPAALELEQEAAQKPAVWVRVPGQAVAQQPATAPQPAAEPFPDEFPELLPAAP